MFCFRSQFIIDKYADAATASPRGDVCVSQPPSRAAYVSKALDDEPALNL